MTYASFSYHAGFVALAGIIFLGSCSAIAYGFVVDRLWIECRCVVDLVLQVSYQVSCQVS